MKNILKRHQHFVPRFYLKYFSTPDTINTINPQIWVFSKHQGDPFTTGVNNVAAKNFIYSPKNKLGFRNNDTENKLMNLEKLLSDIWQTIACSYIDLNTISIRKALSLFISTLFLRNIKQYKLSYRIHDELINFYDKLPLDQHGNPLVNSLLINDNLIKFNNSNYCEFKNPSYDINHEIFVSSIHKNAIDLAKILMSKKWAIVESESPVFITTDNPVTLFHERKESFGFGTKGTVIIFPLNPARILHISDNEYTENGGYYRLNSTDSAPYNITLWNNANEFMFSHRNTDIVCHEILEFSDNLINK